MEDTRSGQSFAFEVRGNSAVIWRCFSRSSKVEIPETIGGYPVTELAPYAFSAHMNEQDLYRRIASGQVQLQLSALEEEGTKAENLTALCGGSLEEIVLPKSMAHIGRYCFYYCDNLKSLEFPGTLADWGSGVFTGVHQVERLCIHIGTDGVSWLRSVLEELVEKMVITFVMENAQGEQQIARILMPDYYEEGTENTPARLLSSVIHGSGYMYRNCFQGRRFDFRQYDTVFPHAKALEPAQLVWRMSIERLRYPIDLTERARRDYIEYLREKRKEVADDLIQQGDVSLVRWFLELLRNENAAEAEEIMTAMIDQAARMDQPELMSSLMNERRKVSAKAAPKRKRLEL